MVLSSRRLQGLAVPFLQGLVALRGDWLLRGVEREEIQADVVTPYEARLEVERPHGHVLVAGPVLAAHAWGLRLEEHETVTTTSPHNQESSFA